MIIFNLINLNSFFSILPFLDLAHIHNYGISFGLFANVLNKWFILFISITVTFIIIYLFYKTKNNFEKWGLLLILAGAISNIFDRALNNYVLDFIYLHYKDYYWPAFNFADIYITFGVLMFLFILLKDIVKSNRK
tara:strand:+ start:175 stop:579 length:405 start_codon:yes stop_codon:yes gene_type:complete